jgi:redox-sensing transcriptional repressor
MDQLATFAGDHRIRLAILATPGDAAQPLADILVELGVRAIWNFTPTRLSVPRGVLARNERFSNSLAEIAYHLKAGGRAPPARKCPPTRASRRVRTPP